MHHNYSDIFGPMNALLRECHAEQSAGMASGCRLEIDPQTKRCTCEVTASWWDENGTPRFAAHDPKLCPDIYADEVALLEVACQGCDRRFAVQVSMGMRGRMTAGGAAMSLESIIRSGVIHYGDPPNVDCCPAGPTMNVWDIRVIEFWTRMLEGGYVWSRVPELEINLPDADPASREFDVSDVGGEVATRLGEMDAGKEPKPVTMVDREAAAQAARAAASQPQRMTSGGPRGARVGAGAAAAVHYIDALCCLDPKTGGIKRCPARRCRAKLHTAADGATICERCDIAKFTIEQTQTP